jgi:gentisate 1,2-dioxygenase
LTEPYDHAPDRNLWSEIIALRDKQRENTKDSIQVVKRAQLPQETNDQGKMRWYMHPAITKTALSTLLFYEQEIPPGSRSGRLKFQGGQVLFIVEGRGYTILDGVRHAWEAGDVLNLPLRRHGIVVQHFNSDPDKPARFVATEPNFLACTTVDRGCGFEQLEPCPEIQTRSEG